MGVVIALWGEAVFVVAWSAGSDLVRDGGAILTAILVRMADDNTGLYWFKTTWNRNKAASVATTLFSTMLVVDLGSVLILGLSLDGW